MEEGCFSVLLLLFHALESISPFLVVYLVRGFAEKRGGENTFFFFLMWKCNCKIIFKGTSSFRFGWHLDIYIFQFNTDEETSM